MRKSVFEQLSLALISLALTLSAPVLSEESALPAEPQAQSEATESVQPQVDQESTDKAAEKRREILAEATAALDETANALRALAENKPNEALDGLGEDHRKVRADPGA